MDTLSRIVSFINSIGLRCAEGHVPGPTFLPGIEIMNGAIIYDPQRLKYPGDLLHEAGHLAVLRPEHRATACGDTMNGDMQAGGVEMAAIAWSWAALKHLDLRPETVFHKHGYKGDSDHIIENFNQGRYMAVPLLQWMGMTTEPKHDKPVQGCFPAMRHWLRP